MNYYLWIDGQEQGPYTLEHIQESVTRGDIAPNATARTETATNWDVLRNIAPLILKAEATQVPAPAAVPSAGGGDRQQVRAHLASVRANSCYPVLRSLIEVCFVLALICVVLGCIGAVRGSLAEVQDKAIAILCTVAAIVAGILLALALVAVRQSAFLLIDIADTLLYDHAKSRNS